MPFDLPILDDRVAYGFRAGAGGWSTSVLEGGGGAEYRNQNWELPKRRFELAFDNNTFYETIMEMAEDRRGAFLPFLMKNWADFELVKGGGRLELLVAEGGETTVQIAKTWGSHNQFSRDITYIREETLVVYKNDVELTVSPGDYSADLETGEITLNDPLDPGDVIEAECEYYTKVRFEEDSIFVEVNGPGAEFAAIDGVAVIEDR